MLVALLVVSWNASLFQELPPLVPDLRSADDLMELAFTSASDDDAYLAVLGDFTVAASYRGTSGLVRRFPVDGLSGIDRRSWDCPEFDCVDPGSA